VKNATKRMSSTVAAASGETGRVDIND